MDVEVQGNDVEEEGLGDEYKVHGTLEWQCQEFQYIFKQCKQIS